MSVEEGCAREGGLYFSPHLVRARYPFVAVRAYGLVPPGRPHFFVLHVDALCGLLVRGRSRHELCPLACG